MIHHQRIKIKIKIDNKNNPPFDKTKKEKIITNPQMKNQKSQI